MKIPITAVLVCLLMLSLVYAKTDLVYSLKIGYDGTTLTNEGLGLMEGAPPQRVDQPETGFFTLKVADAGGNTLHSFRFLIELTPIREAPRGIFSENGTQIAIPTGTPLKLKRTTAVLVIPYFENAKSLQVFDENEELLLSVDVSKYSTSSSVMPVDDSETSGVVPADVSNDSKMPSIGMGSGIYVIFGVVLGAALLYFYKKSSAMKKKHDRK